MIPQNGLKKTVIFVGNGLNRLAHDYSWETVLSNLRKSANSPNCLRGDHKPFTIYFDELRKRSELNGVHPTDFSAAVTREFTSLKPTAVHQRLIDLPVRNILTTNYDYTFEQELTGKDPTKPDFDSAWGIRESKFSLFRCRNVGSKTIWHIHGEALMPTSIMLGHDHYVEHAARVREYTLHGLEFAAPGLVKFGVKRNFSEFDKGQIPFSWIDLFIRDTVHICGFTFDFSETLLWYVLSLRQRRWKLFNEKRQAGGKISMPVNKVIFHYFKGAANSPMQAARLEVLESYGVTCEPFPLINNKYEDAWNGLLTKLETAINSKA